MTVDEIKNGVVIDHITAGKALEIYNMLGMDKLECQVAIIQNAHSNKMGKKDIIKIDGEFEIDLDAIGYVDPGATVAIIKDSKLVEKKKIALPERIPKCSKSENGASVVSGERFSLPVASIMSWVRFPLIAATDIRVGLFAT